MSKTIDGSKKTDAQEGRFWKYLEALNAVLVCLLVALLLGAHLLARAVSVMRAGVKKDHCPHQLRHEVQAHPQCHNFPSILATRPARNKKLDKVCVHQ